MPYEFIDEPAGGRYEFIDDLSPSQRRPAGLHTFADRAKPQPKSPTLKEQAKRQSGLLARNALNTVAALPLAALEGGAGVANLVTGGDMSFSRQWQEGLDRIGLPRPETLIEKGTEIATAALGGSKLPTPGISNPAPAAFGRTPPPSQASLEAGRRLGLVVPPTTVNPSGTNKTLEAIAGKLTTAQLASAKNTSGFTDAAKRSIGLSDDAPLTMEAIDAVRAEAGKAYEAIAKLGVFDATGVSLPKDVAVRSGISPLLPGSKTKSVDAAELLRGWKQANADSTAYFRAYQRDANPETLAKAKAAKDAAKQIHDFMFKKVSEIDRDMAAALKPARELIAKTYSVEDAFNPSTGNVSGTKLARQIDKGKPLSGELKAAANFAQAFPKAAREFNESLPGISPLDFYASGGVSAMSQQPWYLLYPFLRQGVRAGLLSPTGQRLLTTPRGPVAPGSKMGLLNASVVEQQGF